MSTFHFDCEDDPVEPDAFWRWVTRQADDDDPRGDFIRETREIRDQWKAREQEGFEEDCRNRMIGAGFEAQKMCDLLMLEWQNAKRLDPYKE